MLCVAGSTLWLAVPATADTEPTASFDYLYIESNEGGSSGGHVALRFGANIFHFQNRERLLVLDRERAKEFLFSYALLSNRNVHISEIGVEPEVEARIADRFAQRHRAQAAQLATLDALRRDRILLENAERPIVSVQGYGYFESPAAASLSSAPSAQGSKALGELRAKIVARYGANHEKMRRRALFKALDELEQEDPAGWDLALPVSAYEYPIFAQPWSTRITNVAAGHAALDVLEEARGLAPYAVNAPQDDDFRLNPAERAALARYAGELEEELIGLVDSLREDWGQTFLIGMARLVALEASLASDHFVFLDSFPEEPDTIASSRLQRRSDVVPLMLGETRKQLRAALRYLTRVDSPGELAWERVEERLGRHHELTRAVKGESDLRLARGHLVPTRPAPYSLPAFRSRVGHGSRSERARVRARERNYEKSLARLHDYDLLSQNCVTAILDTINDEFAGKQEGSRAALGGVVEGEGSLAFIPFVSAMQVNARYRVLGRYELPSYRELRLQEMREQEPRWRVALRESNTFTAKTYRRAERDSFFVFFTEDPVWLRPLLGAVNLVAALGESAWGIVKLPIDRGQTLVSGLKGTFVSLPELAFGNIRKGSNDWIADEYRRLDPQKTGP